MKFKEYWKSLDAEDKKLLAEQAETSVVYLSQVANNHRPGGRKLIDKLMNADSNINFEMFRDQAA